MKSYAVLKAEAEQRFRNYRNVSNVVSGEDFEEAYELANPVNQSRVEFAIIQGDLSIIKEFIREFSPKETLSVLKKQARKRGIKNWCRLNKFALVEAIRQYDSEAPNRALRAAEAVSNQARTISEPDSLQTGEH